MERQRTRVQKMTFYTYLWLREDCTPYYVGKGRDNRAFEKRHHIPAPPKNSDFVLVQHHASEEDALKAEVFLIEYYGRKDLNLGCLRNQTNGGEGSSGYIHGPAALSKISNTHKGKAISVAQRQQHSRKMQGQGNPMFGKKRTDLKRFAPKNTWSGRRHSVETIEKMRISALKRWNKE